MSTQQASAGIPSKHVMPVHACFLVTTGPSYALAYRLGRKVLLVEGGVQMFICFVVVAGVMGGSFNKVTGYIPKKSATTILAFECLFTAGFAWSWGPLGWLVPSEFHNIETRGTGQAITVCVNFLFSFVIGQAYLTMLCK